MTKNAFIISTMAGIVGNLAKEIISWIFYFLGLVEYAFCHLCAGIFIDPHQLRALLAVLIGMFMDYTIATFFGLICFCIYRMTGGGYHLLRGIAYGGLHTRHAGFNRRVLRQENPLCLRVLFYVFGSTFSVSSR
jgi:hypothetical protein